MSHMPASDQSQDNQGSQDPKDSSLEALFEALETSLLGYAYGLVRSSEQAQDLVQEAFLRLHAHWDRVRDPKPWLFRTVHHLAVSYLRRSSRTFQLGTIEESLQSQGEEVGTPHPIPDEWIAHQEALGLVRLTLDALDDRSQTLIRLKFEQHRTYRQIAEETGLTVGHVGYLLHHAIHAMSIELKKAGLP